MMPSIGQLVIVLLIVVVIFGAKRLKSVGSDLGGAVKGFKQAVKEEEDATAALEDTKDAAEDAVMRETDNTKV